MSLNIDIDIRYLFSCSFILCIEIWHWVLTFHIDIRYRILVLIWDNAVIIGYGVIYSLMWDINIVFGFDLDIAYWYCPLRLALGIEIDIGYWHSARWVSEASYKYTTARSNINTSMQYRMNIQYQYPDSTPISNNIPMANIWYQYWFPISMISSNTKINARYPISILTSTINIQYE